MTNQLVDSIKNSIIFSFKFSFIILFLFVFFTKSVSGKEATFVIINQVRGKESCCHPGNLDLLKGIKNNSQLSNLSLAWALRYDALQDKDTLANLADLGEFGLLLEVTPKLAAESGVAYKGREDGSDWYFAKNAFLIGYTQEERKKIIDTLFESFKKEFGYYPAFTVSWMIDAWSLSYINKTYNVKLHEITREQYETDSYTLYGGIFNAPYYPSKDHPLIPGYSQNKLDMLIVRQTISDLIQNYGSQKAYFTSQPNDYFASPDKLNFSYFNGLLDNTIDQSSGYNFGLLGFENSFSWEKYGSEYIKQLELINQYQKEGKIKLQKPSDYYFEFVKNYRENKPFYLKKFFSPNSEFGVLWYFGKNYRARVIIKNKKIILDDLRNYSAITDPYKDNPATSDYAYWIIPYLIDGSQQYSLSTAQEKIIKKKDLLYGNTLSDIFSDPFGIILGEGDFVINEDTETVEIRFTGNKGGSVKFNPENINFDQSLNIYFNWQNKITLKDLFLENKEQIFSFNKFFDVLIKNSKDNLDLGWLAGSKFVPLFEIKNQGSEFILSPKKQIADLELLTPIFQPDKAHLPINSQKSIFYWNNKKAIVERNPVRLFILPLNTLGRPTQISKIEVNSPDKDKLKIIFPEDYSYRVSPWFIDIFSDHPLETTLSIAIDNTEIVKDVKIEFIADCRKKIGVCLTSAPQTLKYISAILNEQFLKLGSSVKNLWKPLIN